MNKLTSASIIVWLLISVSAFAADDVNSAAKLTQPASSEKPGMPASDQTISKISCITQTGSRLNAKDKHGCNGLPGRSYTKEDIELTGATTLAEALRRLDPSVQIGR